MKYYSFNASTRLIFGIGSITKLPSVIEEYDSKKVLIITDKGVVNAGILDKVKSILDKIPIEYDVFDEVESDPSTFIIERVYEDAKKKEAHIIIALGGGSSIDTSKGVSLLMGNNGKLQDFAGVNKVKNKGIPLIAIPTTAGTGSEVTNFAVLSDLEANTKFTITSSLISPDVAILDPELTLTLPAKITAATGLDALTHAIEAYTSVIREPISDALALKAMNLIDRHLPKAVHRGSNLESRTGMLQAELMAGIAFNNAFLGLCHAIASPLGALCHLSHGLANAIMLPYVMKFNYIVVPEKYINIASSFGIKLEGKDLYEDAYKAVEAVEKLIQVCDMPNKLSQVGVKEELLDQIARDSLLSIQLKFNCREAS
ncbi:MAG: alcohol dehydrogenase, partial [Clostridiales bacterium]|nr:alcohol dehydrogenase [Clostridiales bacterium]